MVALNRKNVSHALADEYDFFDTFEPIRRSEKGRYPVRSNLAQSKANRRCRGRSRKHVHRSVDGPHHRRRVKRQLVY